MEEMDFEREKNRRWRDERSVDLKREGERRKKTKKNLVH